MKTLSNPDRFPFGTPFGSIHPYNSLSHALGIDDPLRPLWQLRTRPGLSHRLRAHIVALVHAMLDWKRRPAVIDPRYKTGAGAD